MHMHMCTASPALTIPLRRAACATSSTVPDNLTSNPYPNPLTLALALTLTLTLTPNPNLTLTLTLVADAYP